MSKEASKRYYEKHKEKILVKRREFNKTPERKAYMKRYQEKNKERLSQYHKEYYDQKKEHYRKLRLDLKLEVIKAYGGVCVCCGETHIEFLTIDHTGGTGAEHRRKLFGQDRTAGTRFYYWLRRNNYPEGFRVLCFNCNCAIGFFSYCPHEKER